MPDPHAYRPLCRFGWLHHCDVTCGCAVDGCRLPPDEHPPDE